MKRQITYYRKRVYYQNKPSYGNLTEAVIFNTPELSYKFHIFILHNGVQTEKLYRKSLSGAKKTAYKRLGIPHNNTQPVFSEYKKPKLVIANVNGKKVLVPEYMEIQVRG